MIYIILLFLWEIINKSKLKNPIFILNIYLKLNRHWRLSSRDSKSPQILIFNAQNAISVNSMTDWAERSNVLDAN